MKASLTKEDEAAFYKYATPQPSIPTPKKAP
jgi:hypothetical protein